MGKLGGILYTYCPPSRSIISLESISECVPFIISISDISKLSDVEFITTALDVCNEAVVLPNGCTSDPRLGLTSFVERQLK